MAPISTVTPPVGTIGMSGNGPRSSRTNAGPSDGRREELHRGRARPPGGEDLGRGGAAGKGRDPAAGRPGDEGRVEVRAHEERRAGVDGPLRGLDRQDRAGADVQPEIAGDPGDRLDGPEGARPPAR